MKPSFAIDIAASAPTSLEARSSLALLSETRLFHCERASRMPLGIYNVSVSRISDKVIRLCQRLEAYFLSGSKLPDLQKGRELIQEVVDYVELTLYASAEHVDDVAAIADGFFATSGARNKNAGYRKLQEQMKDHKRFVSLSANAIKHGQARIRLFSNEITHAGVDTCLHGYFVEGVENGVVGPSKLLHKSQQVFSLTTLVWEVLLFVLGASRSLADFLRANSIPLHGPTNCGCDNFGRAVSSAARLPLYTYGEPHPFERSIVSIYASNNHFELLDSGLYGSMRNGWKAGSAPSFGTSASSFEGDGTTRTFNFPKPKRIELRRWQ
jgi:hypothetical protein